MPHVVHLVWTRYRSTSSPLQNTMPGGGENQVLPIWVLDLCSILQYMHKTTSIGGFFVALTMGLLLMNLTGDRLGPTKCFNDSNRCFHKIAVTCS